MIEKIFGPPGTGKTYSLLTRMEDELHSGVSFEDITFVSFTRAAAREAKKRVVELLPYQPDQENNVSTMHSLCYHLLGLSRENVWQRRKWGKKFAEEMGYKLSKADQSSADNDHDTDVPAEGVTFGDYLYKVYQFARQVRQPPQNFVNPRYMPLHMTLGARTEIDDFVQKYTAFKKKYDLMDFTDMLEQTLVRQNYPTGDVLILDEAQDLTPLEWAVFDMWRENMGPRHIYIAGDDDQAIYNWAGAVSKTFLEYPWDKKTILDQSYRLPERIAKLARKLIERNKDREQKEWKPTERWGDVHFGASLFRFLDFIKGNKDKTAFLLSRHRYILDIAVEHLNEIGIPYTNLRGASPFKNEKAYLYWLFKNPKRVYNAYETKLLVKYVPSRIGWTHGAKKKIREVLKEKNLAFTITELGMLGATDYLLRSLEKADPRILVSKNFTEEELTYYNTVHDEYGPDIFTKGPKLTLGTIHSVKGKEADIVGLFPDITAGIYHNLSGPLRAKAMEDERRVFYVGMTRARESLWFLRPLNSRYSFPEIPTFEEEL